MIKYCTRILNIFLCIITILCLCSWVDPQTVDVYNGQIAYADTQGYNVTRLSGDIQYWLEDYVGTAYDSSGYLFNTDNSIISGRALIGGQEYDVRLYSQGGFQIEQTYYTTNNIARQAWISYNLTPEVLPVPYSFPELAIVFVFILVFLLVCINIVSKGFL